MHNNFSFPQISQDESPFQSGHSQKILALRFHPDDKDVFVTAGWDHSVKVEIVSFA